MIVKYFTSKLYEILHVFAYVAYLILNNLIVEYDQLRNK